MIVQEANCPENRGRVMYAAGLWPIGAIIRIGLFFGVLGLGLFVLLTPVMAIAAFVNPKSK